ncbi:MAG: TIGR00730 family Rossman fold protein, partial [Alphaproteobacteria bacterium]|nr:TIGR00730 family Rossman fold protein [Alphaproteobacteria bacterium]
DRKKMMFDRSDAFVVLPGGLGTLDETFEIMTWAQLSLHKKPIILINHEGYWTPFLELLKNVVNDGFADAKNVNLITVVETADEAIAQLKQAEIAPSESRSDLF